MFDIGFVELMFCAIVGLVVLGPEKLPNAIRSIAKGVKSVKQVITNLSAELSNELHLSEVSELGDKVSKSEKQLNKATSQVTKNIID